MLFLSFWNVMDQGCDFPFAYVVMHIEITKHIIKGFN